MPVTLHNTGTLAWARDGAQPVRLAYHWEPLSGPSTQADYEGMRTELPAEVSAGGVVELVGVARAPRTEGTYRLRWDLVQEGVTWFSDQGSAMTAQQVEVTDAGESAPHAEQTDVHRAVGPPPPPRSALWRAAIVLWREHPLLGIGPDNFRHRYPAVLSPAPNGEPYTDTRIHANNLYLETLADLGLAGIAALAAIALALFGLVRRHYAAGRLAGLGCGVAAGVFFVHGGLDYFLEFTPLFGLFWVLLGLTAAWERGPPPSEALPGSTR